MVLFSLRGSSVQLISYNLNAWLVNMKISKDTLLALAYQYENFSGRENIYNMIINNYDPDLRNPSRVVSTVFADQKQDLQCAGFTSVPTLERSSVEKIKMIVLNNLRPTKNKLKYDVDQNILLSRLEILEVFSSFSIIRPIQLYLGVFPSLHSISAWQTEGSHDMDRTPEMYWHMDHHGHKFVKVFFYLTDTTLGYGHHEFLKGSHYQQAFDQLLNSMPMLDAIKISVQKKREKRGKFLIQDDTLLPLWESVLRIAGKAGMGFMEDTRGLHRGTILPPGHKRIIVQALFMPFNSGKDPIYMPTISNDYYAYIKRQNEYSGKEMRKLFQLLRDG